MTATTRRYTIGMAVCLVLAAIVYFLASWRGVAVLTEEEADIYEAIFRYQFKHEFSNSIEGDQSVGGCFLLIRGRDPPDEFLARFDGYSPPVKKGSRYVPDAGVQFCAERITWVDDSTTIVEGGHFESSYHWPRRNLISPGSTWAKRLYYLVRNNSKWDVRRVETVIIP
jgi:hypothetical protein